MDLTVSVKGLRIKAKKLDNDFYEFITKDLEKSGINLDQDNSIESLFTAYLRLAAKAHNYDREIESIIKEIES
jgi:hypothetical protein